MPIPDSALDSEDAGESPTSLAHPNPYKIIPKKTDAIATPLVLFESIIIPSNQLGYVFSLKRRYPQLSRTVRSLNR